MAVALLDTDQIAQISRDSARIAAETVMSQFYNPFPEIMTMEQICKYTQYSRTTILKLIKEQNFPVSHRCESMRFSRTKVDAWMHGDV